MRFSALRAPTAMGMNANSEISYKPLTVRTGGHKIRFSNRCTRIPYRELCDLTMARMSRFSKTRLARSALPLLTTSTMAAAKSSARII